jgi:hypothetical protein
MTTVSTVSVENATPTNFPEKILKAKVVAKDGEEGKSWVSLVYYNLFYQSYWSC